ncbi:Glycosyl transferase family 31 [Trinorchestia longiramus]|nr:Glycosyl transferase family 31 [Trinorchestia longiramus]
MVLYLKTMLCRLRSSRPLLLVALLLCLLVYLVGNHMRDYTESSSFAVWTAKSERNLSVYVRPFETTSLLSPHVVCTGEEFMVVVVPSSPSHWERRKAIRSTYGQWVRRLDNEEALTRNLLQLERNEVLWDESYVIWEDYLDDDSVSPRTKKKSEQHHPTNTVNEQKQHQNLKIWENSANKTNSPRSKREAQLRLVSEVGESQSVNDEHSESKSTTRTTLRRMRGRVIPRVHSPFASLNRTLTSRLFFLLGRENSIASMSAALVNEQQIYGDVIVEDFIDSYQNLTLKSVFMLKFISSNCPSAKFVVKADDDVFLHLPNIQRTLISKNVSERLILGCLFCFVRPVANPSSKWFSPSYMFSGHFFPNYLSGTSYVLSGSVINPLLEAAMRIPLFHLEDVYITGILAQEIGVKPQDDVGFSYQTRPANPCLYQNVSMAHDMEPVLMYKLWNSLHREGMTRSCKTLTAVQVRRYSPPTNCKWNK